LAKSTESVRPGTPTRRYPNTTLSGFTPDDRRRPEFVLLVDKRI
jgi:hypothetical protein